MTLLEGDELVDVVETDGKADIVLTTKFGQTLRFSEDEVRATGRGSQGVIGIRMKYDENGDTVCGLTLVDPEAKYLFLLTDKGYGKRTEFDEFMGHGRGTQGVRSITANFERGPVVSAIAVSERDDLVITTAGGIVMRTHAADVSIQGRAAQGVRVIRVDSGDKVTGVAVVREDEDDSEAGVAAPAEDGEKK